MAGQQQGSGAPANPNYGGGNAPHRSRDDRSAARDHMMSNVRDSSQQDRRVYVGNLSYDVKWHQLKDFMRQGKRFYYYSNDSVATYKESRRQRQTKANQSANMPSTAGEVIFADVLLLPNGMSKVGDYNK